MHTLRLHLPLSASLYIHLYAASDNIYLSHIQEQQMFFLLQLTLLPSGFLYQLPLQVRLSPAHRTLQVHAQIFPLYIFPRMLHFLLRQLLLPVYYCPEVPPCKKDYTEGHIYFLTFQDNHLLRYM